MRPTRVTGLETGWAHARVTPIRSCSRWGLPCRSHCWDRGGLLPHPFTLTRGANARAVCFLWHFPWGRPRRALPGTVFPWSPDFPPLRPFDPAAAVVRPTGNAGLRGATGAGQAQGGGSRSPHPTLKAVRRPVGPQLIQAAPAKAGDIEPGSLSSSPYAPALANAATREASAETAPTTSELSSKP